MYDCANVEMRELLPELAAGTVDAATRARVEEHVAGCAECASELDTLRLVRGAYASAPAIDTRRIVGALPKPAAAPTAPPKTAPSVKRWVDWRIAAALTAITVGGLSVAVSERLGDAPPPVPGDSTLAAVVTDTLTVAVEPRTAAPVSVTDTGNGGAVRRTTPSAPVARVAKAQLSFNGGVSDLDEASIHALLGALDEIDRAPVAPSAEPDRSPVLPVIKEGDR